MNSKWKWLLVQWSRKLWVRVSLFAVLGIATAAGSIFAEQLIPWELPTQLGAKAVDRILDILASSMLAVTTFSLSVMIAAYATATSNVTPRATRLLMQDPTTQNALAVFIGTFLFSLVGIIALGTGAYGDRGRVILFVVTLIVIAVMIVTILRWIDHLSKLGRVSETTQRVEAAAARALRERVKSPFLGGRSLRDPQTEIPAHAVAIPPQQIGYVQFVDIEKLGELARKHGIAVYLDAVAGTFVHHGAPLARIAGADEAGFPALTAAVAEAFTVESERSFDQDPRFGVSVLSEIASRALSPAMNDPGTAIDVIGRMVRVLSIWGGREGSSPETASCPGVFVPPLTIADLMDDAFVAIARDGAGIVEVQVRLQKALAALAAMGDADMRHEALKHSAQALERAGAALALDADRQAVREAAERVKATLRSAAGTLRPHHP
jgi:uncharacterized membrane protein